MYNVESREILRSLGLEVYDNVDSIKSSARSPSLASMISVQTLFEQEFILYPLNLIASKERNTFSKKS